MHVGKPDPETAPPARLSLVQRLLTIARRVPGGTDSVPAHARWPEGRVAIAVALLIVAGPLLTIGGARVLADQQRAATVQIEGEVAPRIAAAAAAAEARAQMDAVLKRRTLGATIETLARALPADATLARVERNAQGRLALEVATPDPDKLRAALRRVPALSRLRDTGQRQADAAMIVLLEGTTE
jgi:Tfp pilus assembly protein PilX